MPAEIQNPTKQQINQLRNLFIRKYETSPPTVPFHAVDLERIHNNDIWLIKFLEMYDLNIDVSLEKLWFTCVWRQEYGAYDLCEKDLRMDYLTDGAIFAHNYDVDGKPLLIFKTKLHTKGSKSMDDVKRIVVYYIERLHRDTNMDKMTLFFDMSDTGMANMDLDFIRCIIDTFKLYYPNALNYILIYEMAWILNAAFKFIKTLLPEKAQAILKVIKKKDVNLYINPSNCLASWGGQDNYTFHFVPENRKAIPSQQQFPAENLLQSNGNLTTSTDPKHPASKSENFNNHTNSNIFLDKKVHFANGSPRHSTDDFAKMNDIEEKFKTELEMLHIIPNDYIQFNRGEVADSSLKLSNISSYPVTFKIQTTSPEKFRVRPRCGILNPGETTLINILLKADQLLSENARDKFLIMCLPATDIAANQVGDFWKKQNNNSPNVEQHRLCCMYKDGTIPAIPSVMPIGHAEKAIMETSEYNKGQVALSPTAALERQLRCTQILQVVTLVFLFMLTGAVVYLLMLQLCGDVGCFTREVSTDTNADELANEDL